MMKFSNEISIIDMFAIHHHCPARNVEPRASSVYSAWPIASVIL